MYSDIIIIHVVGYCDSGDSGICTGEYYTISVA